MKIFDLDNVENLKDGGVATETDENHNPIDHSSQETKEEKNARLARENMEMLQEEEQKFQDENHGLRFAIRPIKALSIGKIQFPHEICEEINNHIDNVIIPKNDSFADGLVGQLKNDKKSAQLNFPFDDEVGAQIKTVFDQVGTTFLKQGYERDSKADCFQCWTNHAYAGDYNPYHDHGTQTMAGLSGFLWLKVPECISKLDDGPGDMSNASGSVDGFTHLVWGTASRKDVFQLKAQTEEYVKPEVGVMLVFPCWLKHLVLPFLGEGERRSIAMNWNVNDSEQEIMKHLSDREKVQYEEKKKKDEKEVPSEENPVL